MQYAVCMKCFALYEVSVLHSFVMVYIVITEEVQKLTVIKERVERIERIKGQNRQISKDLFRFFLL